MSEKCVCLEFNNSSGMAFTYEGVEFSRGPKSFLGRFFVLMTFTAYISSFFLMGLAMTIILIDIFGYYDFFIYLAYIVLSLLCIILFFQNIMELKFYTIVVLFLFSGGILLYITVDDSLLIFTLPMIAICHICNYIMTVVVGDKLTISLSSNKYKIAYLHKVLDEGEFSQKYFLIRLVAGGESSDTWESVFIPADKYNIERHNFRLISILKTKYDNQNCDDLLDDMGKLFDYLGVCYERDLWVINSGDGARPYTSHKA